MVPLIRSITKWLHKDTYEALENAENELFNLRAQILDLSNDNFGGIATPEESKKVSEIEQMDPLNAYLGGVCGAVPKFAFSDKMKHGGKWIPLYPNELITPDAYNVQRVRKQLVGSDSWYNWYKKIGEYVARQFTWKSDDDIYGMTDHYEYPAQALITKKVDCEGHAFVVASIEPNIGVAYGMHNGVGHAFNIFVQEDKLYILDSVGKVYIEEYKNQKDYKIHYIFTKDYTYILDDSLIFGNMLSL